MSPLLTFVGTRGNIQVRGRRHRWHTSTIVSCCDERVMIDCGTDWLHRADRFKPSAIVLTHAHPGRAVASAVAALGQSRGIATRIANDGLQVVVDS